jgi:hypothetical protein
VTDKDENENDQAFRVLLQSAHDVAIVRQPPWWTVPRALGALGVLALAILGVLAWVWCCSAKPCWNSATRIWSSMPTTSFSPWI